MNGTTEQRFALDIRLPAGGDEPGLVLDNSGVVYVVLPDGTRQEVAGGGGDGALVTSVSGGVTYATGQPDTDLVISAPQDAGNLYLTDDHADQTGAFLLVGQGTFSAQDDSGAQITAISGALQFQGGGQVAITIDNGGGIELSNLPQADPAFAGQLWVDPAAGYALKVSQG